MGIKQSEWAKGRLPIPYPSYAGEVVAKRFTAALVAGDLDADDIVEMAPIPPGFRVVDMIFDADDLDTNVGPTITADVGIMSGLWGDTAQDRTCGAEFFAASTVAQAGGAVRPTLKTAFRTGVTDTERSIGIKFPAAAATAAAGTVGLTVFYASE